SSRGSIWTSSIVCSHLEYSTMLSTKKLQVFVSSTYTDLRDERQAAVEAILSAGHIPAGMELFTAGDQSQMDVIRRWIDESDVFLLILGGRYGSIEPRTKKSYIHLEYEYATEQGKPLFAVVLDEAALDKRVRKAGKSAIEIDNPEKLRDFRKIVLSKVIRFWSDLRDIKLAIHEKMSEFNRRSDLIGWIPGDQAVSAGLIAEELARVTKENGELRRQLAHATMSVTYNGLGYDELELLLANESVAVDSYAPSKSPWTAAVADPEPPINLLERLWDLRKIVMGGPILNWDDPEFDTYVRFGYFGLLTRHEESPYNEQTRFILTEDGRKFLLRLIANRSRNTA
ncbi:MAG TPA: DUF4062 domain-containing protein, partial [Longimicrobium sp.]|nr:DUF4062 domain-containing protein [Longimicrobium sp.]